MTLEICMNHKLIQCLLFVLFQQTIQQWQYVFLICAAVLFFTGLIYVCFADSTLQSWNQPKTTSHTTKEEELKVLNGSFHNNLILSTDDYDNALKV